MIDSTGAETITSAIRQADTTAICGYVTAGYPDKAAFVDILASVGSSADVIEIGVPFTDPMADGLTIQRASHVALENGVNLAWILEVVSQANLAAPVLLMGYYNPFLAFGMEGLGEALAGSGVSGLIVPDAPLEESGQIRAMVEPHGLSFVQLVTPTTSDDRLAALVGASSGFVYAVTTRGVTGGNVEFAETDLEYLDRVREASSIPVLAGFGIRSQAQVLALSSRVDGVVVGSALIDAIDRGDDPGEFLASLRPTGEPA